MKVIDKNSDEINDFANKLLQGELIAIPTETVYGLAANALDSNAVKNIFTAKGRPQDNPLILHTYSKEKIYEYTKNQPKYIEILIDSFMPGPLTLVLEKKEVIPDIVTAGLDTVGIRIPNNESTLKLLRIVDVPLAAPSANKSGRPSPTKVQHIIDDYGDSNDIYGILDGGECTIGIESTIIKCEENQIIILRPGQITKEDIKKIIDIDVIDYKGNDVIAPGMKYKHYSPNIPVILSNELDNDMKVLNLSYNGEIANTISFTEQNIYSIFREAENNYSKINIILSNNLINNSALYNRILKAVAG